MHEFGECRIESGEIIHRKGRACAAIPSRDWCIPISDIRLIAEFTTPGGPVFGYFDIFIAGDPPRMNQIPMESLESVGINNFFGHLEAALGGSLPCHLASSTDYASSILWPQELDSQPLFEFRFAPPDGVIGKLIDKFAPRIYWTITNQVINFIGSKPAWAE